MHYHNIKLCLIALALNTLLSACEKELDIKYHDINPLLVIEGELTQTGVSVTLTETTPMDEPINQQHLTDASVVVVNLSTDDATTLHPDSDGIYKGDLTGETDTAYRLTVNRNGKTYQSESMMHSPAQITGIDFNWIKMPYDDVAILQVSFTDNPDVNGEYYWVRVYRNGELYRWSYADDRLASEGVIDFIMLTTRRNIEEEDDKNLLVDGDIVTATVSPVSRAMYEYIEAMSQPGCNGPAMFDGGLCLGYFLAAPVTSASIVFHPDEITYDD